MTEQVASSTEKTAEAPARRSGPPAAGGREGAPAQRAGGFRRRPPRRRKFCKFCADKSLTIDHKDPDLLKQFENKIDGAFVRVSDDVPFDMAAAAIQACKTAKFLTVSYVPMDSNR